MGFSGDRARAPKSERARLLALALAVLLLRGGERVGMAEVPRAGRSQLMRLARDLQDETAEYGAPQVGGLVAHGRAVFVSDFLGDIAGVESALTFAADRGVKGVLLQVLDPAEEEFPFDGRTIFESMGGGIRYETQRAGDLRGRYLLRLAERKDRLAVLARAVGWQYGCFHTGDGAQPALLWAYAALEGGR